MSVAEALEDVSLLLVRVMFPWLHDRLKLVAKEGALFNGLQVGILNAERAAIDLLQILHAFSQCHTTLRSPEVEDTARSPRPGESVYCHLLSAREIHWLVHNAVHETVHFRVEER